jgi:hypothetical protein
MESLLNAHAGAMRKLLKPTGPDKQVSADSLKLLEAHAKTARLLHAAAAAYGPYVDAAGPPALTKVPRTEAERRKADVRVQWCQARDAAKAGLQRATTRSEKLLKKSPAAKAAGKS